MSESGLSSRTRFSVIDLRISSLTFDRVPALIDGWVAGRERHYVNVCTTHTVLECHDTPELAAIVNQAGMATPDGMPLVWLGRLRGHPVERVYGPFMRSPHGPPILGLRQSGGGADEGKRRTD